MTWHDDARRAATEHDQREQERAEVAAAHTIAYIHKLTERLGVRAGAGTDRLGESVNVDGDQVTVWLPRHPGKPDVQLRATVQRGKPTVWGWVRYPGLADWIPGGEVETIVDLGRVLDPTVPYVDPPDAAPEDDQATAGDLLLQVLTALVRDVVAEALDDRLDSGT